MFFLSRRRKNLKQQEDYNLLQESEYFDSDWYLCSYPDVAKAGVDPLRHYLTRGWKEKRNPSAAFDGNAYLKLNPDISGLEINPLLHYEKYGRAAKRPISLMSLWDINNDNQDYENLDLLILTTVNVDDGVYLYRVKFMSEYFANLGFRVETETLTAPTADIIPKLRHAKTVIFNRPGNTQETRLVISAAMLLNKRLIMDIDDILLPSYARFTGALKSGYLTYSRAEDIVAAQSKYFFYASVMTASTPLIASKIQEVMRLPAVVLPNRISAALIRRRPRTDFETENLRLLYASGSNTHDFDSSEVICDLTDFMLRHPNTTLTVLGRSSLGASLSFLKERLTVISRVSFDEMLEIYGCHDLLLVPLNRNPFNNGKSNIKFIEAGAVGTPVLAADCDEFRAAVKDGHNGFLYKQNDFGIRLEQIYRQKKTLPQIGEQARQDVINKYSTASVFDENSLIREQIAC